MGCSLSRPPACVNSEIRPLVEIILTGLENPRGVAVSMTGELYVAEAGTGLHLLDPTKWDGKLTKFTDLNGDGDFEDEAEAERWFSHFTTYNGFSAYGTGRDEVSGPSDLLLHKDGRLFLSVDDGGLSNSLALHVISPDGRIGLTLADRNNMNGIAFDRDQQKKFAVEISFTAEFRDIVVFPLLDSGQQAVPAGLAVNPRTGDLLVTLYPADGCPPRVLASGLDAPTNITIGHDGSLYISVGQGTPGRPIPGPDGITQIRGEILRITNFLSRDAVEMEQ